MSQDTGKARLPDLPSVTTGNPALDRWIQAATEIIEVREGARGNPAERVVLQRDIKKMGLSRPPLHTSGVVARPDGTFARLSADSFSEAVRKTTVHHELTQSINNPNHYSEVPNIVRELVQTSMADEAQKRGADIRLLQGKQQTDMESLAYEVQTMSAALDGSSAGVRHLQYAYATADSTTAGQVLTLQSRINNFSPDGTPGTATLEETFKTVADRTTGLESSYFLKVQVDSGGKRKISGFGVSATADPTGAQNSAFVVLADKFAVVIPGDTIADPMNPPADRIPFGVDASGLYINGQVRINASGATIESVSRAITLISTSSVFNVSATSAAAPTSVILTAALNGGLTGMPTFTVVSGSASLTGSGLTRALAYSGMSSDRVIVRASVTMSGVIYSADALIYKVYDGATGVNGENGANGANGQNGAAGTRGSVTRYGVLVGGTDWNSTDYSTANALVGEPKVIGDTVTLSSSVNATTKYWSGFNWENPGVVINGNLLVNGTVSAPMLAAGAIVAGSVTITNCAYISGIVAISGGAGTYRFQHNAGRNVVGTILMAPPGGIFYVLTGTIYGIDMMYTDLLFTVITPGGIGYTGSITAAFAYL